VNARAIGMGRLRLGFAINAHCLQSFGAGVEADL
jgi:hypothetical protein